MSYLEELEETNRLLRKAITIADECLVLQEEYLKKLDGYEPSLGEALAWLVNAGGKAPDSFDWLE